MGTSKFLHGIALKNYRGIGDEVQYIAPFEKFNFFIGPNNSGKSTILHFISNHLRPLVSNAERRFSHGEIKVDFESLDVRIGTSSRDVAMAFAIPVENLENKIINVDKIINQLYHEDFKKLLNHISLDEFIWVKRIEVGGALSLLDKNLDFTNLSSIIAKDAWYSIWTGISRMSGGELEYWVNDSIKRIANYIDPNLPEIKFIPAIRQITKKGNNFDDFSGKGLIEELARLQNPGPLERFELEKFKKINDFLKSVTDNESAVIEVTFDREHVLVHIDEKVLPLENLGTGIHEVVMLAAFCTILEDKIICIEEPEIHLHPILQKRLIRYLDEKTSNQYFIATHSSSLIDFPSASVFRVDSINGFTKLEPAITHSSKFDILRDLGYRASDLLQANSIIWVEGPSDRIYLKHWILTVAPELREGIDFSIMFYGGRLLSHLSAKDVSDDNEIEALIELRKLNRNLAVIIDSDKAHGDDEINFTKRRIFEEVQKTGVAWVTEGREIENYVHPDAMSIALSSVYSGKFFKRSKKGIYDHVLPFKMEDGTIFKNVDKVAIAKFISTQPANLEVLGLENKIKNLVEMIRNANRK